MLIREEVADNGHRVRRVYWMEPVAFPFCLGSNEENGRDSPKWPSKLYRSFRAIGSSGMQ